MATQKAIVLGQIGAPLTLTERPIPTPGDGEVLIKVTVCGLNPYEHYARDWGLYVDKSRMPVVLGNDIAGVVEQLGPNIEHGLQVGDHVFGQSNYLKNTNEQAGLQQYCVLDAYTTNKVPAGFSDDDGASLCCNIIAPFWSIFGAHGLDLPFPFPPGPHDARQPRDYSADTILIIGAGGNCGRNAVQLCKLAGFGTIVATAAAAKADEIKSYGATHVVDRHAPDAEQQIRALVGDDLLYAFDAVNLDHSLGVRCLSDSKRGTLACILPGQVDAELFAHKTAGYDEKFTQGQIHNQPALAAVFATCLPMWLEQRKIRAVPWGVLDGLDPAKVNAVLDGYRDGKPPPKQVHVHVS
ncbi:hypothetical protein MMC26_003335 [Xylographa opegraphella]|nr:hypothetical protein [Xylographa opegraphella]